MHAGFIYPDTRVCKALLYQARHLVCHKSIRYAYRQGSAPTGLKKTCHLPSWTPSWIYKILNDAWIASLGCYNNNVCNSRISKICRQIPGVCRPHGRFSYIFCNKLPSWRPSCPHSSILLIFYLVTSWVSSFSFQLHSWQLKEENVFQTFFPYHTVF